MKSVMQHAFSQIPAINIQRSSFNRSHGYKTTFDAGRLVPILVDEVLPGDTFNLRATLFCRLATPVVPFMDNLFLETFFFFVPNRLVWEHWKAFNGEQKSPSDTTDYLVPTMEAIDSIGVGSVPDYLGIPTDVPISSSSINALPFRALSLIWNEWFRDENIQVGITVPTGDGPDPWYVNWDDGGKSKLFTTEMQYMRGKRHDYFTSCLPWPQKGSSVDVPLAGGEVAGLSSSGGSIALNNLYITGSGTFGKNSSNYGHGYLVLNTDNVVDTGNVNTTTTASGSIPLLKNSSNSSTDSTGWTDINGGLTGSIGSLSGLTLDLSNTSAVTINSLRQAIAVQQLLELDARGGTRYTEIVRAHFGVVSPDARLQRPEYLGGSSTRININPVQQTSSTDSTTPQGNLAAFGVGADSFHGFTESFTEHGYVIGLVNVRADLTYQQGLNRMWSRQTRYDFYWPTLAHLGEQAVLNKEIYYQGNDQDDEVFGYQERYAEYRYFPSMITGEFRSTYDQSLDVWHLSQKFDSLPALNNSFIMEQPPIERVVAVTSEPQFLLDVYFDMNCVRPMPVYGVPGLTRM